MRNPQGDGRRRRVAVVTGTRAEYGLLHSVMDAIACSRRLSLQLVVTGMHLLKKFGHTVDDITRDGWHIDACVRMQTGDDSSLDQAIGLSRGVVGIARFIEDNGTDVIVVLGDRIEALAGALAGVTTGRVVAHIHGGDLAPGDLDDGIRHAITKLAHLHLAATASAKRRIIRMGEPAERVYQVGAPGVDRLVALLREHNGRVGRTGRAAILQHPCGRPEAHERRTMQNILRAAAQTGLRCTVIYPNSDRGHSGVISAIEKYRKRADSGSIEIARSLDRDSYLRLLIGADVLIGNSSSGIIEAPFAGTPVVNVGPRQDGRQRAGRCVVDAGESLPSIQAALAKALRKRPIMGRPSPYGDGSAGLRIADILARATINGAFRRKKNAY